MLCGGYTEEFLTRDGSKDYRVTLPNPDSRLPELLEEFLIQLKDKMFRPMFFILSLAGGSRHKASTFTTGTE